MPHKVPQNIDLEDKVIGPLTLKQFAFLGIGGGILLVLNYTLPKSLDFLLFPIGVVVAAFFGALAFFRPGDRPFTVYLGSVLGSLSRPSKRIWKKLPYKERVEGQGDRKQEAIPEKHVSSMDLRKLAFVVDSGGFAEELETRGIKAGINERKKLEESKDLHDTILKTEVKNESLTDLIREAKEKVLSKKKEPSVQDLATVKQTKKYTYEKLEEKAGGLTDYEEVLTNSKTQQEKRFEEASVRR